MVDQVVPSTADRLQPWWTPRARKHYDRAMADFKQRCVSVVRTATRKYASTQDWYDGKKTVQGLAEPVRELRASAADRVLIQEVHGHLVIVDVGNHDVVAEFVATAGAYREDQLSQAEPALPAFNPSTEAPLFVNIDQPVEPHYAEELSGTSWLSFLSDEQARVADALFERVSMSSRSTREPFLAYISGGAGTGKTVILLNLAIRLREAGFPVRFECSAALTNHLRQYTGINVRSLNIAMPGAIRLIDDPASPGRIDLAWNGVSGHRDHTVIAGFDPLQWRDKRLAEAIAGLPSADVEFHLSTCYRQGANLGLHALEIVAAVHDRSSWRSDPHRVKAERDLLKELEARYLANLQFVKPGGRSRVIDGGIKSKAFADEVEALRARFDRWHDMPSLLILEDREHGVTTGKNLSQPLQGIKRVTESLQTINAYRGLDFQAVWIFMSKTYYERIQKGQLSLSKQEWESLRDLHVAFTRAKDETIVVLV